MSKEKRIYIADDETNIRLAIKAFLEDAGYIVEDFENGELLLKAFCQNPADLVILDVMMPGLNGFVVCKELRKLSRVPIIMLTARDSDLDYATGLDLGGDDYLVKPFSPVSLVMRVKTIFRRMEFNSQVHNERDPITGLFTRNAGIFLIENEIMISNENSIHALFLVDINSFKVNKEKEKGMQELDEEILMKASKIISNNFRAADVICRFGGSRFMLFAKNIGNINFSQKKAEELCNSFEESRKDGDISFSAGMGISCYPKHGHTYEELYKKAEKVLLKIKDSEKNGFIIYS